MPTAPSAVAVSDLAELYALIKRFEGCRLMPYICPAGVLTCGWGSTGHDVYPGRPWTQEYADRRLEIDAKRFAAGTMKLCPSVSPRSLCALADFAYNVGLGALQGSTLRKRVNAKDWEGAMHELKKWVHGGGKVLPGLVARRGAEASIIGS